MDKPPSDQKQPDKQLQHKPTEHESAGPTTAHANTPGPVVGQPMTPQTLPASQSFVQQVCGASDDQGVSLSGEFLFGDAVERA